MSTHSYCVRHKNGWGTGCGPRPTHCYTCGAELPKPPHTGGSGYGSDNGQRALDYSGFDVTLKPGEYVTRSRAHCYDCCANKERARMIETGRATLYLVNSQAGIGRAWTVQDWAGRLCFPAHGRTKGRHNMARVRYDVAFTGPDGKPWRATQYGYNTQIAHCRRIK